MPLQYIPYLLHNWQEKQLLAQECQFISPTHPTYLSFWTHEHKISLQAKKKF